MTEDIFNVSNKLSNYNIEIGDKELIKDIIGTIEMSYKNDSPVVLCKIIILDLVDLGSQFIWRDQEVIITYMDFFKEEVKKTFIIKSIQEIYNDKKEKNYIIELQDKFSYKLQNSYISKSYSTDPISAIKDLSEHLQINEIEDLSTDYGTISDSYDFIIPRHINNLEFLIFELSKHGYVFYQNKKSVIIKRLLDLIPSDLPTNGDFTNATDNKLYKNKIIEVTPIFNNRKYMEPKTESYAYDIDTKKIKLDNTNDNSDYYLNDDNFNLQNDFGGFKSLYQTTLNFDKHLLHLKKSYLRQAEVEMVINGYTNNDLNMIYNLYLLGNKSTSETATKGNVILGGKYISSKVIDKIIGDTFIQKITLQRTDMQENI